MATSNSKLSAPDFPPLPHYLVAEKTTLGVLLLNNAAFETVANLSAEEFFLPEHRLIFATMIEIRKDGRPVDAVTLTERLHRNRKLDQAGGAGYVSQLGDGVPHAMNIAHYAQIIKEKASLRALIHAGAAIQQISFDGRDDLEEIVDRAKFWIQKIEDRAIEGSGNGYHPCPTPEFLARPKNTRTHLIEQLVARGGSAMIFAKPHHLKSLFTLALAYGATVPGTGILGRIEVRKPVRTLLISIEDPEGELDQRIRTLLTSRTFADCDPALVDVWSREAGEVQISLDGTITRRNAVSPPPDFMKPDSIEKVIRRVELHKADMVVFDVLRMCTSGDINAPKESALMCKNIDLIRDRTGASVVLVHHENRKAEDIMGASAGSFNWPGWANSCIRFTRKQQDTTHSSVEMEVDNKFAYPWDPCRLVYDTSQPQLMRLEALEDLNGTDELRRRLADEWTVRDLAEALDVHKSNALRRLKKMESAGMVEKVKGGKRGRRGGLAHYQFLQDSSTSE